MKIKHRKNTIFLTIFVILVSLIGSLLIIQLFRKFTRNVIAERDEQILNLIYSVDNTLAHEMSETRAEFSYMIKDPDHQELEREFLKTGDPTKLKEALSLNSLEARDIFAGILVSAEDRTLVISGTDIGSEFTFLKDEDGDVFAVCKNEQGEYHAALQVASETEGIAYYLLLSFANFYADIVPEELYEKNWVVFYDAESGFATQNHDNQPSYLIMTEEEILARNDGYTIIMEHEKAGELGAVTYQYENYYGETVDERIMTLPSCLSKNGIFAIGISRDSEELYASIRESTIWSIFVTCILIIVASGMLYIYLRYQYKQLQLVQEMEHMERENRLIRQLTQIQIQNSVSQMQPHFMFNAMSSIRELIMENPEYASEMLYEFTKYLRSCINAMGSSKPVPFTEEMKNIEAYVKIEKMRLDDKLQVVWDIEDTDFEVLPLTIQPLVENAIRHGICKKRGKHGTVTIATRSEGNRHIITVSDDGTGFDIEQVEKDIAEGRVDSTAIKNIRFRLEQAMNATLTITSTIGAGSKVTVTINE